MVPLIKQSAEEGGQDDHEFVAGLALGRSWVGELERMGVSADAPCCLSTPCRHLRHLAAEFNLTGTPCGNKAPISASEERNSVVWQQHGSLGSRPARR